MGPGAFEHPGSYGIDEAEKEYCGYSFTQ